MYICIHELLNVFEDSAQREHTIDKAQWEVKKKKLMQVELFSSSRRAC